jgi:predicted phage terminase large subunit-like protein
MASMREIPTPQQRLLRSVMRADLTAFTMKVFQTLHPEGTYTHNWHIDAITHQLQRLYSGENQKLLITQPPRTLKTICTSVAFVAWAMGHDPSLKTICVSYSQELAVDIARKFRVIVQSAWYQELFPKMRLQQVTDGKITTTLHGERIATSIGGTLTGRGGGIVIIDDPLKADEAHSQSARDAVFNWFTNSLLMRFDDQTKARLILVMQRLHQEDLAGHLEGQSFHLDLPAIAVERQGIALGNGRIHVREEGDLLDPVRLPRAVLDDIKSRITSLVFSAQFQQRPTPLEGNVIKRVWFPRYEVLPDTARQLIVQSWDVANSLNGNYSVCTTWAVIGKDAYLVHVCRVRKEFAELKKLALSLAREHSATTILVEKTGVGAPFHQELRNELGPGRVTGIEAKGDKADRLVGETAALEAGQVVLPKDAPWLADYLNELLAFPNGKYDDQVDSTTQFLSWYRRHILSNASLIRTFAPVIIEP